MIEGCEWPKPVVHHYELLDGGVVRVWYNHICEDIPVKALVRARLAGNNNDPDDLHSYSIIFRQGFYLQIRTGYNGCFQLTSPLLEAIRHYIWGREKGMLDEKLV